MPSRSSVSISSGQRLRPLSRPWVRLASQKPPLRPDAAHPTVRASTTTMRASGSRRRASSAVHKPGVAAADDHEVGVVSSAQRGSIRLRRDVVEPEDAAAGCRSRLRSDDGCCRPLSFEDGRAHGYHFPVVGCLHPLGPIRREPVAADRPAGRLPGSRVRRRGPVWQVGHQKTLRSLVGSAPSEPSRIACRSGGRACPRGRTPRTATWAGVAREGAAARSRLARIMRAPRSTSAAASVSCRGRGRQDAAHEEDLVGVHVAEPRDVALIQQRDVARPRDPHPTRRAASPGSQSGPSGSGPRWPTRRASSRVGTTSMSARSKPTASHRSVPTIARACECGRAAIARRARRRATRPPS